MKRRDLMLMGVVLAIGLALFLARGVFAPSATQGVPALRVTVAGEEKLTVPLDQTRDFVFEQADGQRNVVHIFPGGFSMAESTCRNQDCVKQGEVTMDNLNDRPLYNQIICLPNQVVLEWVDAESGQRLVVEP